MLGSFDFVPSQEELPIESAATASDDERNNRRNNERDDKRNDERNEDRTRLEELTIYAYFDESGSHPTGIEGVTVLPVYYGSDRAPIDEDVDVYGRFDMRPRFVRGLLLKPMGGSRECNCTGRKRRDVNNPEGSSFDFVPAGLCAGHFPVFQRIGTFRSFVDMPQAMLDMLANPFTQDIVLE